MTDYGALAREIAAEHGVEPGVFWGQIELESGFNPDAISPAGAVGIAQIMPQFHPDVDPHDPIASLHYAARLMRSYLDQYGGSYPRALAAYNWGPGNVASWDGQRETLPGETKRYLDIILGIGWESREAWITTTVAGTGDQGLNLRSGPNLTSGILGRLEEAELVTVLGRPWVRVQPGGKPWGWVAWEYLEAGRNGQAELHEWKNRFAALHLGLQVELRRKRLDRKRLEKLVEGAR